MINPVSSFDPSQFLHDPYSHTEQVTELCSEASGLVDLLQDETTSVATTAGLLIDGKFERKVYANDALDFSTSFLLLNRSHCGQNAYQ